jgi:hypothetical protein
MSDQRLILGTVLASCVEVVLVIMAMTIDIHPMIEVGTITGALRVSGKELTCRIGDRFLTARLIDGRFVMAGGFHGEHSLDAHKSITSADRLLAHWKGYVEGNVRCHMLAGGAL